MHVPIQRTSCCTAAPLASLSCRNQAHFTLTKCLSFLEDHVTNMECCLRITGLALRLSAPRLCTLVSHPYVLGIAQKHSLTRHPQRHQSLTLPWPSAIGNPAQPCASSTSDLIEGASFKRRFLVALGRSLTHTHTHHQSCATFNQAQLLLDKPREQTAVLCQHVV